MRPTDQLSHPSGFLPALLLGALTIACGSEEDPRETSGSVAAASASTSGAGAAGGAGHGAGGGSSNGGAPGGGAGGVGGSGGSRASTFYGSGINTDAKANLQAGWNNHAKVAHRFRAGTSSTLSSIALNQRGGPIYSGGDGGEMLVTVQTDSGGNPSGTVLSSLSFSPGNPSGGWEHHEHHDFASPASLTEGVLYHVVFENTAADPVANYISVNEIYVFGDTLVPRQPAFSDDYAVLYAEPTSWSVQGGYTAVMDLAYADGTHDGNAYFAIIVDHCGVISGDGGMVRERFTVSGGDRTVGTVSVRLKHASGGSPLVIRLETGDGVEIESATIPGDAIPLSPVPDGSDGTLGGGAWVTASFLSQHVLADGQTYHLQLSTAADTEYIAVPIREQTEPLWGSYAFRDGSGQHTTDGATWEDLYLYDAQDLQFYFQ